MCASVCLISLFRVRIIALYSSREALISLTDIYYTTVLRFVKVPIIDYPWAKELRRAPGVTNSYEHAMVCLRFFASTLAINIASFCIPGMLRSYSGFVGKALKQSQFAGL